VSVIGRHHLGVDAVVPDNVKLGALAAQHLVDFDHRNVLVAAGSDQLTTIADRLSGMRSVFAKAGRESPCCTTNSHSRAARESPAGLVS
jgi:LacI family transcriptional regulator